MSNNGHDGQRGASGSGVQVSRVNLNHQRIPTDCGGGQRLQNFMTMGDAEVAVYFERIDLRIIELIREADAVFGCVAWLTSARILSELATKEYVSILVQKEDFLRPDGDSSKELLRARYRRLRAPYRIQHDGVAAQLSMCADPSDEAVRCVGVRSNNRREYQPRMHNKFAVFAKANHHEEFEHTFSPYAVLTGSYNWTETSVRSLENIAVIYSEKIAAAYYRHFQQIYGLSEPLDWSSEWVEPQYRIGT